MTSPRSRPRRTRAAGALAGLAAVGVIFSAPASAMAVEASVAASPGNAAITVPAAAGVSTPTVTTGMAGGSGVATDDGAAPTSGGTAATDNNMAADDGVMAPRGAPIPMSHRLILAAFAVVNLGILIGAAVLRRGGGRTRASARRAVGTSRARRA